MKMRKVLFILALLVAAISIQAQDYTITGVTAPLQVVTNDTITDTGADTVDILLKIPHFEPWGLSAQVVCTNATGTTDIDVDIYSSIDGTNYHLIDTEDNVLTANSAELEDVDGYTGRYLRIIYMGGAGSTQTTDINAYIYVWRLP